MNIRLMTNKEDPCFTQTFEQNYRLWYEQENWSKKKTLAYMEQSLQTSCLPVTIVAETEHKLLGTCQLAMNDLDVRPQYYPWLINLSVISSAQGRGIAKQLILRAIEEAKRLHFNKLYLYTEHEGFFEKFGFEFIEKVEVEPDTEQFVRVYKKTYL